MKKSKNKKKTQMDIYKTIRKPAMPAPKVINPKKYDRRDKSWLDEGE